MIPRPFGLGLAKGFVVAAREEELARNDALADAFLDEGNKLSP
jgi:hypothetical protein